MKFHFTPLLLTSLILGCSSNQAVDNPDRFKTMTGGQSIGDATSLYWYTEQLEFPYSAADFVSSGDYGWYKSDYRWREGKVWEIVREGEQRNESLESVPYKVHLRFNSDGEAVYQQYRLDGKVLPLTPDQIEMVRNEAVSITRVTKEQSKGGSELVQGYWDGELFVTCKGNRYKRIEFNQTLPTFVINRLSALDNYIAFVGSTAAAKLTVWDLLILEDDGYDCIERPSFIEDE